MFEWIYHLTALKAGRTHETGIFGIPDCLPCTFIQFYQQNRKRSCLNGFTTSGPLWSWWPIKSISNSISVYITALSNIQGCLNNTKPVNSITMIRPLRRRNKTWKRKTCLNHMYISLTDRTREALHTSFPNFQPLPAPPRGGHFSASGLPRQKCSTTNLHISAFCQPRVSSLCTPWTAQT